MAKTEITPLPWEKGPGLIMSGRRAVACYTGNGVIRYADSEDEREANAAFIVLACNNHDALVAACRGVSDILQDALFLMDDEPVCEHLKAALKLVEARHDFS